MEYRGYNKLPGAVIAVNIVNYRLTINEISIMKNSFFCHLLKKNEFYR